MQPASPEIGKVSKAKSKSKHAKRGGGEKSVHSISQHHLATHPLYHRKQSRVERPRSYFLTLLDQVPDLARSALRLVYRPPPKDPNEPVLGFREREELRKFPFTSSERKHLLSLFREMAGEKRNSVSFPRFVKYFRLAPDAWAMRLFEIINQQLTGKFTFLEFSAFLVKYLVFDRDLLEEFSFRMYSRRGSTFTSHSVLDLEDFTLFVSSHYGSEFPSLPLQKRVALDILALLDTDKDGGVGIGELSSFSKNNASFLRLGHALLCHLRKCVLGLSFWVDRSRAYKYSRLSLAQQALESQSKCNSDFEKYSNEVLKVVVTDERGRVLEMSHHLQIAALEHKGEPEMGSSVSLTSDGRGDRKERGELVESQSQLSLDTPDPLQLLSLQHASFSASLSLSQESLSVSQESLDTDDPNQTPKPPQDLGVSLLLESGTNTAAFLEKQRDYRTLNSYPFSLSVSKYLSSLSRFKVDFPELFATRQQKRELKRQQEKTRRAQILEMRTAGYLRLIRVVSDLLTVRGPMRMAFEQWCNAVLTESERLLRKEKEGEREVHAPHRSALRRLSTSMGDEEDEVEDEDRDFSLSLSQSVSLLEGDDRPNGTNNNNTNTIIMSETERREEKREERPLLVIPPLQREISGLSMTPRLLSLSLSPLAHSHTIGSVDDNKGVSTEREKESNIKRSPRHSLLLQQVTQRVRQRESEAVQRHTAHYLATTFSLPSLDRDRERERRIQRGGAPQRDKYNNTNVNNDCYYSTVSEREENLSRLRRRVSEAVSLLERESRPSTADVEGGGV